MKIPFFSPKPTVEGIRYFGLFLKAKEIIGFELHISAGKLSIEASEKVALSNGWDSLVQDVDDLLFRLENNTGHHLDQVIFFVYSYFIDKLTKEIKKPYKDHIKEVVKNLELKPLGYIECYEAVANYLERKNAAPLNAVLVELDSDHVGVIVYKGGKKAYETSDIRSASLVTDLEGIFAHAKESTMLPSRVVVYDSDNLNTASSEILTHTWKQDIFVQLPRIEVIKEQELQSELGQIFADQVGQQVTSIVQSSDLNELTAPEAVAGFAIGKDVAERPIPQTPIVSAEPSTVPTVSADTAPTVSSTIDKPAGKLGFLAVPLAFLKPITTKIGSFIPQGKWASPRIILIGVLILILVSLVATEYFFHKAVLTVFLPSKTIENEQDITSTVGADDSEFQINEGLFTVPVEQSKATSGKRDVGDKAHGEVTIHNFDDKDRIIAKGTTLSVDSISFILDQDVKVASASETTISGGLVKQPGKSKGNVTASVLGTEGNIAKNKRLTIADLPSAIYFAINENAFSGGTKKQVKTVARTDMDGLEKEALDTTKKEQLKTITDKLKPGERLIETLTEAELSDPTFSKEVGEEADAVKLSGSVQFKYYYYQTDKLKNLLMTSSEKDLPEGYVIDPQKVTFTTKKVDKTDDEIDMTVETKAIAIQKVSEDKIKKAVAGKTPASLKNILEKEVKATSHEVKISPSIVFGSWMPFFSKNIDLKIGSL